MYNVIFRSALALHSADDEEDEVVEIKARKRHRKLDFSGEGPSELLFYLFYVQLISLRFIWILASQLILSQWAIPYLTYLKTTFQELIHPDF